MGRLLFFWMSSFLVTFICYWTLTAAADDGSQQDDNNRNGIHSSKLLSSIGIKLNRETTRQKRVCSVGGGMSNQCVTDDIDQQMKMRERLKSGQSPGKRNNDIGATEVNDDDDDKVQQPNNYSDNLAWNPDEGILLDSNKDLQLIRRIIGELKMEVVAPKKKKTCLFNLGGHCSTESAAFLADRWHYLDSPMSPGRKRFSNSRGTARELEERQVNDGRE